MLFLREYFERIFDEWESAFLQKEEISNICYNWQNNEYKFSKV